MTYRIVSAALTLTLAACGSADQPKGEQSTAEVAREASAVKLNPGQWEATYEIVSVDGAGMPPQAMAAMKGHKTTVRHCITPEQAEHPNAGFLSGQKNKCSYRDWSMAGGRISGTMICAGGMNAGPLTMKTDGRYAGDSYDMTAEMENAGPSKGVGMTIKSRASGKRIGECPAGDKI